MSRSCGLPSPAPAPFLRQSEGGRRRRAHFLALGLAFLSFGAGSALARSTAGALEGDTEARPAALGSLADPASKGRLLVASRDLLDPAFAETVVLVLESGPSGTIGVVVNRPSELETRSVLPDVKALSDRRDRIFLGGPVDLLQLLLLVRATDPPDQSMRVFADVFVTGSLQALHEAADHPSRHVQFRLFAGHTGWGPGQLEGGIARGDWLVVPGDVERVFAASPEKMWSELVERDGGSWVRFDPPASSNGDRHCSAGRATPTMPFPCESRPSPSCSP